MGLFARRILLLGSVEGNSSSATIDFDVQSSKLLLLLLTNQIKSSIVCQIWSGFVVV